MVVDKRPQINNLSQPDMKKEDGSHEFRKISKHQYTALALYLDAHLKGFTRMVKDTEEIYSLPLELIQGIIDKVILQPKVLTVSAMEMCYLSYLLKLGRNLWYQVKENPVETRMYLSASFRILGVVYEVETYMSKKQRNSLGDVSVKILGY